MTRGSYDPHPLNPCRNYRLMRPLGVRSRATSCKCIGRTRRSFSRQLGHTLLGISRCAGCSSGSYLPQFSEEHCRSTNSAGGLGTHLRALVEILPNPDRHSAMDLLLIFGSRSSFRLQGPSQGVARPAVLSILIPQRHRRGVQKLGRVQMTRK